MLYAGEIAVAVLAGITICISTLGLISVLRNYGRLRQRMYLFVISLTMANVIVGMAFLTDAIIRMLDRHKPPDQWNNQSQCELKPRDWMIATESLRCASIVLSSLNSIILTYSLHMRTTRMGRHREDSSSISALHTEGASSLHLPVFDTMMRVLSFSSSSEKTEETSKLRRSDVKESLKNSKRKSSSESRNSSSNETSQNSQQERRKSRVTARFNDKRRMSKFASILVPRSSLLSRSSTRFSHASDSYVGRHSVSVVSIRSTLSLIFFVWFCFVTMWITPIILRSNTSREENSGSTLSLFSCPHQCNQTISEARKQMGNTAEAKRNGDGSIYYKTASRAFIESSEDENLRVDIRGDDDASNSVNHKKTIPPKCDGCSSSFYPLTKIEVTLSAVILVVTWVYMLYSSMRLLWLRKHSNNVFVRCSALWRFILFTAIFHLLTTSPYVTLCFIDITNDVITTSQYSSSYSNNKVFWKEMTSFMNTSLSATNRHISSRNETSAPSMDNYLETNCLVTSPSSLYHSLSCFFILFHTAFAPLFYLLRLLGVRRLLTFA